MDVFVVRNVKGGKRIGRRHFVGLDFGVPSLKHIHSEIIRVGSKGSKGCLEIAGKMQVSGSLSYLTVNLQWFDHFGKHFPVIENQGELPEFYTCKSMSIVPDEGIGFCFFNFVGVTLILDTMRTKRFP